MDKKIENKEEQKLKENDVKLKNDEFNNKADLPKNDAKHQKLDEKEQKRAAKIQKKKDKEKQLERDIELMKKEINNSKKQSGKSGKSSKKPSKLSIAILVIGICAIVFFFGSQLFDSAKSMLTDELSTSDFVQAVEQERVVDVTFDSGAYTVSGTYHPSQGMGASGADAFKNAIEAINSGTLNVLNPVQTKDIESQNATVRNYTATFVGQDALLELMQKHPNIQYRINLPSA